jgi:hypothetical protein
MSRRAPTRSGRLILLGLSRLAPRKGEQLPGQCLPPLRGARDGLGRAPALGIVGDELLERVNVTAHDHQQIVEVVGDAGRQLAERVHLLRMRELLLRLLQRGLGLVGRFRWTGGHLEGSASLWQPRMVVLCSPW